MLLIPEFAPILLRRGERSSSGFATILNALISDHEPHVYLYRY